MKSARSVRGLLESSRQSLDVLRRLKEDAKRTDIGYSRSPIFCFEAIPDFEGISDV